MAHTQELSVHENKLPTDQFLAWAPSLRCRNTLATGSSLQSTPSGEHPKKNEVCQTLPRESVAYKYEKDYISGTGQPDCLLFHAVVAAHLPTLQSPQCVRLEREKANPTLNLCVHLPWGKDWQRDDAQLHNKQF